MPDYNQSKIYRIECNITNEVYYGSTTQKYLCDRLSSHKYDRKCSAINIIDRGNFTCKIIEEFNCNSKQELKERESYYIRNNLCINKQVPGRTQEEWYQDNREKMKQKSKDYREKNNERIDCECGGKYTTLNKIQHFKTKKHQDYLTTLT